MYIVQPATAGKLRKEYIYIFFIKAKACGSGNVYPRLDTYSKNDMVRTTQHHEIGIFVLGNRKMGSCFVEALMRNKIYERV